jgi:hypothetical protein
VRDVVILIDKQIHAAIVRLEELVNFAEIALLQVLNLFAVVHWQRTNLNILLTQQNDGVRLHADLGIDLFPYDQGRGESHDLRALEAKLPHEFFNAEAFIAVLIPRLEKVDAERNLLDALAKQLLNLGPLL